MTTINYECIIDSKDEVNNTVTFHLKYHDELSYTFDVTPEDMQNTIRNCSRVLLTFDDSVS